MSRKVRFLLGVVIFSPLVFLLWQFGLKAGYFTGLRATMCFLQPGLTPGTVAIPESVSNIVPFLVLMLATPMVPVWDRVRKLVWGIGILAGLHLLAVAFTTHWVSHPAPSTAGFFLSLLSSTVMVAAPFVLWLALDWAFLRLLVFGRATPKKRKRSRRKKH